MLITTLEELRLFSPANAIDNIDSIAGFINSSEHDFLEEKLGTELYQSLQEYYNEKIKGGVEDFISQITDGTPLTEFPQLLYVAQKAVTYDALSRAVSVQAISVNGNGVNVASAEDYKAADSSLIADYKKACVKEAHSAVNELLVKLEKWTQETTTEDGEDSEKKTIVELWRKSRYFYLAASMLIPSAAILQVYMNIYDSREKFITLLPDIRYIQEDVLEQIYGEEFIEYMTDLATKGTDDKLSLRIIHGLRKVVARHLEARMLKQSDPRKETAYNEAVKLTDRLSEKLTNRQGDMDEKMLEAFAYSPLYVKPETATVSTDTDNAFHNNETGNALFVTPGLS